MYIGFVGPAGSGKSTIGQKWAQYLHQFGYDGEIARGDIALPMKRAAVQRYGITLEDIEAHKDNYRTLLQEDGRLLREHYGSDYLLKQAVARVQMAKHGYIENVRLLEEARFLERQRWVLIGLAVDPEVLDERYAARYGQFMTAEQKTHETEVQVRRIMEQCCNLVLENNTLEQADEIAKTLAEIALGLLKQGNFRTPRARRNRPS